MDFKRKLGHGLSALFSSDDEIDQEIERLEKTQSLSQEENPFSAEPTSVNQQDQTDPLNENDQGPFEQSSGFNSFPSDVTSSISVSYESSVSAYSGQSVESDSSVSNSEAKIEATVDESIQNKANWEAVVSNPISQDIGSGSYESADQDDHVEKTEEKNVALNDSEADVKKEEGFDVTDPISSKERIQLVDIYRIEPDRQQPRKSFDSTQLSELAASIRQYGVLQPLLVSKEEDYYKIIAGERRYRAARMAGLDQLPVIIREFADQDKMAVALIENIQRQELNPMEEANAYRTLMDKYQMTQEEIAEKLNKSRSSIANLLRLQKLPESVQKSLSEGLISFGHAKVLLGVEDPIEQTRLALQIVSNNLSVRELEDLVHSAGKAGKKIGKVTKTSGKSQTFAHRLAEDQLKNKLSTKVSVNGGKRKGNITIEFYSQDDLERILSILGI